MKINLGISILIISAFTFTQTVSATSGACSSHGGVNCSLSNSYTSVICNDGSTDSSTKFSDLQECKVATTCDSGQVIAFSASRGLLGSSFGQSASLNCEAINNPQVTNSVPSYTISEGYLDEAVKRKATEYCVNKFGTNAIYKSSDKRCSCAEGYLFNSKDICSPKNDVLKQVYTESINKIIASSTDDIKNSIDVNYIAELKLKPENKDKKLSTLLNEYLKIKDRERVANFVASSSKLNGVVDVDYIIELGYKPENTNKSFIELINETYFKNKISTSTDATTTQKLSKSLKIGSRGPEVSILQSMLGLEKTAYFGPKTREAVIKYQKLNNLPQTGVVGEMTRKILNK